MGGEQLTDDGEFEGHEYAEEMEKDLENGPFASAHESPGPGREDESIPCCDSQCADEKILVCTEMGRKIQGVG